MSVHLPRQANIAHMFTSLHQLSSIVSPFLLLKCPRYPRGASHRRTLTGGPASFKATLNVSTRISQSSPVLIPLDDEEEAAAAAKDMHIPLDKLFIPPGVDASQLQKAKRLQGSNIVLSPYAKGSQIKQAEFIKSSSSVEECPANGYPEFALVGRSNVGKSSLVNALVRRKQLAMTSKKPGKTQLINHFLINDSWYLVDLPGYGYAIAPHAVRTDWNEFTKDYFLSRKTLVSVLLLIDASIPAKQIDIDCATWLGQNKIPMTFVFTKCDKRKKKKGGNKRPSENVNDFQNLIREFFEETPPWIMTSSVTNQGRDEMLLHIAQLRNYWLAH
ncbi:hypothetical protein SUGI_0593030 [Cryptomeria japonica]|uniref:GTP-binding protein At2g22870 n=1 Tax=Cryptomeria japonica TaxID=3369 RepID=UPI0024148034|nr:GTP-binding protein At2g22870 [Cryptomeria japonica]GLJ29996.1 hypothetical protein SUGI_0593030 [Cryptomeria japonica]